MKTIIVATDFSAAANNAARYAAQMALAVNADLRLLYIYETPMNYGEMPLANDEEELSSARNSMHDLKEDLKMLTGNTLIITSEVTIGRFMSKLRSACDSLQPYVVVLGSQETTAVQRILFGSHATNSLKNLEWPVITVPMGAKYSGISKIGIACNIENVLECVPVNDLKMLLEDLHAELYILDTDNFNYDEPEIAKKAGELMLQLDPIKVRFRFIKDSDINAGILDFANLNHLDLLLVAPKHKNILDRFIYNSSSKFFVLHSHVPIVSLH